MATQKDQKSGFQDYGELSAIFSAFIKLLFVIKLFILSFYSGFTVIEYKRLLMVKEAIDTIKFTSRQRDKE